MSPLGAGYSLANLLGVAAANNRVWMVDGGQGFSTQPNTTTLFKINTSVPTSPTIAGQTDLTTYGGASRVVRVHRGHVFVGLFPASATLGNRPGSSHTTAPFVIVDTETDAVLGVGSVSVGGDTLRPRDFAFDGSGNVYVNATDTQTGIMKIYKYVIADVISAFPSVYNTPTAIFANGEHLETITYGAGYIWGSTGLYHNTGGPPFNTENGRIVRIDPVTGTMDTYTSTNSNEGYWGCHFAFGSLWASGGDSVSSNQIFRFDASSFPGSPTAIVVDPSHSVSNTCEISSDDISIWVTNGSSFTTGLPSLWRVDPVSETLMANPSATGTSGSTQSVAFDGANIWSTIRYANNPGQVGLAGFSNGVGTESFINTFTSSQFFEPISVSAEINEVPTFFNSPISITSGIDPNSGAMFLWVADKSSSIITKVDPFAQPNPIVHSQINLTSFGVDPNNGVRQVKYNNGIIYACCHDNNILLLIDAATDSVIGKCSLNGRSRSVAFDGAGNFWASTMANNLFANTIYKFSIAATLAAFPGSPSPLFQHSFSHHIEHLEFFGGFLWLASGGFQNFGATDKFSGGTSASLNGSTLSGLSGMTSEMNGYFIRLANCGVSGNNSMFRMTFVDSSTVTLSNFSNAPTTDTNNGNIVWNLIRAQNEPLMRIDPSDLRTGSAASITASGSFNLTITVSGLTGMTNADIGKSLSISNAVGTCFNGFNNNNILQIESVINSSTVTVDLGYIGNEGPPGYNSGCAQPVTDANNGSLQWMILTSHNGWDWPSNGFIYSIHAFAGSLWAGNGFHGVTKWDPNNYHPLPSFFPLATANPKSIISPTNKQYFQGGFAFDGTYVWTTADYGGGGSHSAIRIDPNTDTIIAEIPTDDTDHPWTDDIAFDGSSMWMTSRNGNVTGIIRFSTTLGAEAQTFRIS